jgi:hypothetical protein
MDVKNWSAKGGDSVNNVRSLTFPTVSVGIISIAREYVGELKRKKGDTEV